MGVRDGLEHPANILLGGRGPVIDSWMPAGRRRLSPADPPVKVGQPGAEQRPVIHCVEWVRSPSVAILVGQGQCPRAVLRAGVVVNPNVIVGGNVTVAIHVGVDQRSVTAPIFGGGVDKEYLGQRSLGRGTRQQAAGLAGLGVGLVHVGEWKQVVDAVGRVGRGLTETVVELPAPASRHQGNKPVEHSAVLFVPVQSMVEIHPEKTAALRPAEGVGVPNGSGAGVARLGVSEERGQVSSRQQPHPHDGRRGGGINHLVDLPGLEFIGQVNVAGVGYEFARFQLPEGPLVPGDDYGRGMVVVPHSQH